MDSEKEINEIEDREKFKKSKFSKVLLIFFALAILMLIGNFGFFTKILISIQACLFILAWLMEMKIVKEPKKGLRILLAIVAFVLIVPIINTSTGTQSNYKRINWEYIALKEHLPRPKEEIGKIIVNSDDYLSVYIRVKDEDDYRNYIESCKKFGYTIDAKNDTNSYTANSEDGYNLRIWFSDYNKEYNIYLEKESNEEVKKQDDNIVEVPKENNTIEEKKENNEIEVQKENNEVEVQKENNEVEVQKENNEVHIQEENNKIDSSNTNNELVENTSSNTTDTNESKEQKNQTTYNYYTTNDDKTAASGKKGKYSYVKKGKAYDIYWLIDFDKGYVYNFTERNEDNSCEKVKIKSGDLNNGLKLSYKDSDNEWAKSLHFKYKDQPYKLIIVDNDNFTYEYETTSLEDTLNLMKNREFYEP